MSISRRSLFGLSVGAVAAAKAPMAKAEPMVVGLDFGRFPAAVVFGNAGEQYAAAMRAGTLAQHSNIIAQEMNDLRRIYPTDPKAFISAARAWKSAYLEYQCGGEIGVAIDQMITEALK